MMNQHAFIEGTAARLWEAGAKQAGIDPVSAHHPDFTINDAYQIQMLTAAKAQMAGCRVVGKKIGMTSKKLQDLFHISSPTYGHLYDTMLWAQDVPISIGKLNKPKIEAELAFILEEDIQGPGVTMTDVLRATTGMIASFEIIDSRYRDWQIQVTDSIADNGSAAGMVLGTRLIPVKGLDLRSIGVVVEKNGVIAETAASAIVMGNPALAVTWLANELGQRGIALKKGEIILSGSFITPFAVAAGDVVIAHFGDIGSVKAIFGE